MRTVCALAMVLSLAACGDGETSVSDDIEVSDGADVSEASDEEKGGETYSQFDERRDSYDGALGEFEGQGCTVDCSGHEAGYAWAEDRGITDPEECGGKSWSFAEGCQAYAEEHEGE